MSVIHCLGKTKSSVAFSQLYFYSHSLCVRTFKACNVSGRERKSVWKVCWLGCPGGRTLPAVTL